MSFQYEISSQLSALLHMKHFCRWRPLFPPDEVTFTVRGLRAGAGGARPARRKTTRLSEKICGMRSLPSHIVLAAALATLANTVLSHSSAHVKKKAKAAPIFYRSQRMEQPLLADVPACHVHVRNHTVHFHVPSAPVTPRSWHDARRVPLSAWAGDCHAESDSFP